MKRFNFLSSLFVSSIYSLIIDHAFSVNVKFGYGALSSALLSNYALLSHSLKYLILIKIPSGRISSLSFLFRIVLVILHLLLSQKKFKSVCQFQDLVWRCIKYKYQFGKDFLGGYCLPTHEHRVTLVLFNVF